MSGSSGLRVGWIHGRVSGRAMTATPPNGRKRHVAGSPRRCGRSPHLRRLPTPKRTNGLLTRLARQSAAPAGHNSIRMPLLACWRLSFSAPLLTRAISSASRCSWRAVRSSCGDPVHALSWQNRPTQQKADRLPIIYHSCSCSGLPASESSRRVGQANDFLLGRRIGRVRARLPSSVGQRGHRSITGTSIYTAPVSKRFKDFWRDCYITTRRNAKESRHAYLEPVVRRSEI
jgi:hypothetical protein